MAGTLTVGPATIRTKEKPLNPATKKAESLRLAIWTQIGLANQAAQTLFLQGDNAQMPEIVDRLRKAGAAAQALDNIQRGHPQPKGRLKYGRTISFRCLLRFSDVLV